MGWSRAWVALLREMALIKPQTITNGTLGCAMARRDAIDRGTRWRAQASARASHNLFVRLQFRVT